MKKKKCCFAPCWPPTTLLGVLVMAVAAAAFAPSAFGQVPAVRGRILLDSGWHLGFSDTAMTVPPLRRTVAVTQWLWKPDAAPQKDVAAVAAAILPDSAHWRKTQTGGRTFRGTGSVGYAWLRTMLPPMSGSGRYVAFRNSDSNAWLYLNGKLLCIHRRAAGKSFGALLDRAWHPNGPNVLTLLVGDVGGAGAVPGPVTLGYIAPALAGPAARDFNDQAWKTVQVPNDDIVDGKYSPKASRLQGYLPVRSAWYRRTFMVPAAARGRKVWLYFEGVYRDAQVYVNGKYVGEHQSGFTSFRLDVTRYVDCAARNVVSVLVDPCDFEGWWYQGGGIYRHVWLVIKHRLHVTRFGTFIVSRVPGAIRSSPQTGDYAAAKLTIETTVRNERPLGVSFALDSMVHAPDGKVVAQVRSTEFLKAGAYKTFDQSVPLGRAELWSLGHRNLYRLRTIITTDGVTADDRNTIFGIRTLRFSPSRGFFLNGKHVELQGTCDHQDFAALGIGVPDNIFYWRIKKLLAMGSNAIRTAHNPVAPEFLDGCDRLGLLVMEENRHLGDTYAWKSAPGTPYSRLANVRRMVLRDRNHPSIIMWSMCNEEGLVVTRQGAAIFKAMRNAVHKIDPTRPVMCAQNPGWPKSWGENMNARLVKIEDLQGINYKPHLYSRFHGLHPKMPIAGSEISSGGLSVRGMYPWNSAPDFGSRYSANYNWPWESWYPIVEHPFVMGGFVWTGFDYRGEPNPSNYPDVSSNFGLMDLCGFPKDVYYYFKAAWTSKPLIHLIPGNWNWPGHLGQGIGIRIYSNCQQVTLLLNGKRLAKAKMPPTGFVDIGWPGYYHAKGYYVVHYQPGTLEACGYDHGRLVATDIVKTTGKPTHLALRSPMRYVRANGEDVALVDIHVEDAKGRVVPNADNMLHFTISGPGAIAGVCNGNSHCLEPNLADYHQAFNGLCQLEVRAESRPGVIHITVSAGGLAAGAISIPCVKAGVYALPPHGTY